MNNYKDFNTSIKQSVTALESLMMTNVLSNDDKAILRINRFKRWLLEYQHTTNDESDNEQTKIDFQTN